MMKAVRYHDFGGPEVLCYEDAPIPEPGPHEVRVHVHAAGVNPADRQIRAGLRFRLEKPFAFIPGCEVSGIVEKCGSEVTALALVGGVGHIAVQLAKWRGDEIIGIAPQEDGMPFYPSMP